MSGQSMSDERKKLLEQHYPSKRPGPKERREEGTFEIAIVLAGAVSAGAYTGGVMDFLTEALDEWCKCKAEDDRSKRTGTDQQTVPHHNVVLKVITGASAGGMNGAIAAAAYSCKFPHANVTTTSPRLFSENPFYSAWVDSIDITPMLDVADLEDRLPGSLLNCTTLKKISDSILSFCEGKEPVPAGMRDWLADPFELRLTNTNLRGVPYAFDLKAGGATAHQGFLMHGDQVAFSISRSQDRKQTGRPDCIKLSYDEARACDRWRALGTAGLATGAFPIALASRNVAVGRDIYDWRLSFFDNEAQPGSHVFVTPAWPSNDPSGSYCYAAVDGGVMNNEPFELARSALAGPRGRNNQNGTHADRAVIVIDPFIEDPEPGPSEDADMIAVAAKLIPVQVNQARLNAQDFVQIQREDVYSRFMIMPKRKDKAGSPVIGKRALATGELGAFGGFFCRDFRHHDYLLGRRNAQRFLQAAFTLPQDNSLFAGGRWTDKNNGEFADPQPSADGTHLQIIPLCNHLNPRNGEPQPKWPVGAYRERRDEIAKLIAARVNKMSKLARSAIASSFARVEKSDATLVDRIKSKGFELAARAWLAVGWWGTRGAIIRRIGKSIDDAMTRIDGM